MQKTLSLLRTFQDYDLEIEDITARNDELRESLDELYAMYNALKTSLDAQKAQLEETRALMRAKEIERETNRQRYEMSKSKLNQVSNTREYNALEKEMDALKKMRAQLEEEHESLREALEGHEADVAEKEAKTATLQAQIRDEEAVVAGQSKDSDGRIGKLENERDRLKNDIPKAVLRRYEFIAGRRPGRAVVAARDGVCVGCNMMIPPQLYNEIQRATQLIQCPSCQRILFHESENERSSAEA